MQASTYLAVLVAFIGLVGSVLVAMLQARGQARKTAADMFASLCDAQQTRIDQLQRHIDANEQEIAKLHSELAELRRENETLRRRVHELEVENIKLRGKLALLEHHGGSQECTKP